MKDEDEVGWSALWHPRTWWITLFAIAGIVAFVARLLASETVVVSTSRTLEFSAAQGTATHMLESGEELGHLTSECEMVVAKGHDAAELARFIYLRLLFREAYGAKRIICQARKPGDTAWVDTGPWFHWDAADLKAGILLRKDGDGRER